MELERLMEFQLEILSKKLSSKSPRSCKSIQHISLKILYFTYIKLALTKKDFKQNAIYYCPF